jgi:hypothetical protein
MIPINLANAASSFSPLVKWIRLSEISGRTTAAAFMGELSVVRLKHDPSMPEQLELKI